MSPRLLVYSNIYIGAKAYIHPPYLIGVDRCRYSIDNFNPVRMSTCNARWYIHHGVRLSKGEALIADIEKSISQPAAGEFFFGDAILYSV